MANLKKFFKNKNVMVTGGLGFIGSNLVRRLVDLGAQVTIVDSLIPEYGGNLFNIKGIEDKIKVNISDIRDMNSMKYLVKGRDIIFNLAGQVSHIDSMREPFTDLEINCLGQLSLLECCRQNNPKARVIFASTRQIYGRPLYLPVDEKHLLRPVDVNGINKMAGEWYHILYHRVYNLPTVSLRLTNTYGPRSLMKHNRQGFVYWFIRQALDNKEIEIFGDGSQRRDLNYVDDVVEAFLLAAASPKAKGQIFNLGSNQPISLRDFTEKLIKIAGSGSYKLLPLPKEREKIEIGDCYLSYEKIKKTLGWRPQVSLDEGLKKTIDFFKKYKKYYW